MSVRVCFFFYLSSICVCLSIFIIILVNFVWKIANGMQLRVLLFFWFFVGRRSKCHLLRFYFFSRKDIFFSIFRLRSNPIKICMKWHDPEFYVRIRSMAKQKFDNEFKTKQKCNCKRRVNVHKSTGQPSPSDVLLDVSTSSYNILRFQRF